MKKLIIPVLLCVLVAGSCKKEPQTGGPDPGPTYKTYGSIDEIFNELSLKPKVVSFDAAAGSSFYGNSGTRYIFQPNSFQNASNATVTGIVQVEVTEYTKKGDMIFSGVLPISNGEPLVSGGEIKVRATQSAAEIFLKPGKTFTARIPQFGSKDTVMEFFSGDVTAGSNTNKVNWRPVKDSSFNVKIKYKDDSISLFPDSLKFCNADKFLTNRNDQSFSVTIVTSGATLDSPTLLTYALFDNYNGLWQLGRHGITGYVYSENHIPDIPVHFVSFCLIKGHFYGGVFAATPKTGSNYTITLTEVDPAAFKAQIALYH